MDAVDQVLALNRLTFDTGDPYNSETALRTGLEAGTLVLLTEPVRPSIRCPLRAYLILRIDKRVLRIERLAVTVAHRNAGLGGKLLTRGRKWRDRYLGASVPIWTYISTDNLASINAHVHSGFGLEAISGDWCWVMG